MVPKLDSVLFPNSPAEDKPGTAYGNSQTSGGLEEHFS